MVKIFILGGRSGTTLMTGLLMVTGKFKNWSRDKSFNPKKENPVRFCRKALLQVPYNIAWIIYDNYPNVPMSVLKQMDNSNLAKLPELDLIIDLIIKRYKDPLFIILERDITSQARSHIRRGMGKTIRQEIFVRPDYKREFKKITGRLPIGNWFHDEKLYWEFMKKTREKHLKNYNPKNILRIDFDYWMNNFDEIMIRVSEFLELEPRLNLWNKLRKIKVGREKSNIDVYLK